MQLDLTTPYGYCKCGCGEQTKLALQTSTARGTVKGKPRRFLQGHRRPAINRYTVENRGHDTPCWIWQGAISSSTGYGAIGRLGKVTTTHRFFYEAAIGPVPDGLTLDHLCRVRACCNPTHLEPVTRVENLRRGAGRSGGLFTHPTHCLRGHEYTPENTYVQPSNGHRKCRECKRLKARQAYWADRVETL